MDIDIKQKINLIRSKQASTQQLKSHNTTLYSNKFTQKSSNWKLLKIKPSPTCTKVLIHTSETNKHIN